MPFPSSIKFGMTARRYLSYTWGTTHQLLLTRHKPATQDTSGQLKEEYNPIPTQFPPYSHSGYGRVPWHTADPMTAETSLMWVPIKITSQSWQCARSRERMKSGGPGSLSAPRSSEQSKVSSLIWPWLQLRWPRTGAHCVTITRRNSTEVLVLPLESDTILKEVSLLMLTYKHTNCSKHMVSKIIPTLWLSGLLFTPDPSRMGSLAGLLAGEEKKKSFTFWVPHRVISESHFRGISRSCLPPHFDGFARSRNEAHALIGITEPARNQILP